MKAIFLLLVVLGFLVFDGYLILNYPHQIYQEFVSGGVTRSYLKVKSVKKQKLKLKYEDSFWNELNESHSLWISSHYLNFNIVLPYQHPLLRFRPIPVYDDKRTIPMFSFTDTKNTNLFVFRPSGRRKINFSTPSDDLFSLKSVENYILSKSKRVILKDVFKRDLGHQSPSFENLVKEFNPLELAYNVYVYKLREQILDFDFKKLYFLNPTTLMAQIDSSEDDYDRFMLLTFYKGFYYKNVIKLYKNDKMALSILNFFSKNFYINPSRGVETSREVYSKFSILPFKQRLTTQGISLIYSAWTHEMDNQKFIQELIYFLERGEVEKISLLDVYSYARNRWGSNFSTIKELRDESLEFENNRIEEENKKIEEKRLIEDESDLEQRFNSGKDKLDYLLKKAKSGDKKKRDNVYIQD